MTKKEIKDLWPDWRIEFVCEYATEKLRNILGINFVYLRNEGWQEWDDGTEFYIPIIFEYKPKGTFLKLEIHQDLFIKDFLDFDKKTGADKVEGFRDKAILRLAWHLKEEYLEGLKKYGTTTSN